MKTNPPGDGSPSSYRYRKVGDCATFRGGAVRKATPVKPGPRPTAAEIGPLHAPHAEFVAKYLPSPGSPAHRRTGGKQVDCTQIHGASIGYKVANGRVTDELAIRVYVQKKVTRAEVRRGARIPKRIGGVRTDVIQRGAYRLLDAPTLPERLNPGETVKHPNGGFGTMTCVVAQGTQLKILSASHVLALGGNAEKGNLVEFVLTSDENRRFPIGRLDHFDDLRTPGYKSMDAATALTDPGSVNTRFYDYTRISTELAVLTHGLIVKKYGRHNLVTNGFLVDANAVENVPLDGLNVQFVGQVGVRSTNPQTPFAVPGDSGALAVSLEGIHPVGMVIAAVDDYTLITPIGSILAAFGVVLVAT